MGERPFPWDMPARDLTRNRVTENVWGSPHALQTPQLVTSQPMTLRPLPTLSP